MIKTHCARALGSLLLYTLLQTASLATTATSLGSFADLEEPHVVYYPGTNSFVTNDAYPNITDQGGGVFKMELRYRNGGEWWDGDRFSTSTRDRGRAEVKGLGPHQRPGETYDFISTWRTNSGWRNTSRFAHIFQLFAVQGNSSVTYCVQQSLQGSQNTGRLIFFPNGSSDNGSTTARNFTFTPNTYTTHRIQVKAALDGHVKLSIDGDALIGAPVDMTVPNSDGFRPKWGLYRGFNVGYPFTDSHIEIMNVQSNLVSASEDPGEEPGGEWNSSPEAEKLMRSNSGGTAVVDSDSQSSAGARVNFRASAVGHWIEFTFPNVPAGTYRLAFTYKAHSSRGICTFALDGNAIGAALDQYSATDAYPQSVIGTVSFAQAGTHVLRMTVAGRNPSASNYYLSADRFTFTQLNPAAPTFTPSGGTYNEPQTVVIATTSEATTLRYTVDGSTPTATHGTVYTEPVLLGWAPVTLKAVAVNADGIASPVVSQDFNFVDIAPPSLSLPEDLVVEATSPSGAQVSFTAAAHDNRDGDVPVTFDIASGSVFPLGETIVTATAVDSAGNRTADTFTVTVVDTTAPQIVALTATPNDLGVPNHKMVPVTLLAEVSDAADPAPHTRIIDVRSNELPDARGSGQTANDWEITGELTLMLRAERAGSGDGRIYTISVESVDIAGNRSVRSIDVTVRHDNRRN